MLFRLWGSWGAQLPSAPPAGLPADMQGVREDDWRRHLIRKTELKERPPVVLSQNKSLCSIEFLTTTYSRSQNYSSGHSPPVGPLLSTRFSVTSCLLPRGLAPVVRAIGAPGARHLPTRPSLGPQLPLTPAFGRPQGPTGGRGVLQPLGLGENRAQLDLG